jgi:hypothetical protein
MLFDLAILLICITGLWKQKTKTGAMRGRFWQLLRRQGLSQSVDELRGINNPDRNLLLPYIIHCQYLSFHLLYSQSESCVCPPTARLSR